MKIHTEFQQGSDEWHRMKLGKISASSFYKLLGTKAARNKYLCEIASERITASKSDSKEYTNFHMQRGNQFEDVARQAYSFKKDFIDVEQVGLIQLNDDVVCSPDGLVNGEGLIVHDSYNYIIQVLDIVKKGIEGIPKEYYIQMQVNLYISDRKWCDYVLYNPKHAMVGSGLFLHRVERDMIYNDTIKVAIDEGIKTINQYIIEYKEAFQ
jgi:exodeoxyribonuclease (lambda-induced)